MVWLELAINGKELHSRQMVELVPCGGQSEHRFALVVVVKTQEDAMLQCISQGEVSRIEDLGKWF